MRIVFLDTENVTNVVEITGCSLDYDGYANFNLAGDDMKYVSIEMDGDLYYAVCEDLLVHGYTNKTSHLQGSYLYHDQGYTEHGYSEE